MKIGYIQFLPEHKNIEKNVLKIAGYLKHSYIDLVILPELFNTGYAFESKDDIKKYAEDIPDGFTTQYLIKVARFKKMYIIGGIAEKDNGDIYNTAVVVGPEGYIGKYQKTHLFYKEKEIFSVGTTGFSVFNIKDTSIGIIICFDWIFPEAIRTLALKGAEIICHPANLVLPYCQSAMVTRAIENRVFIITANRIGREDIQQFSYKFTGKSQIVGVDGNLLLQSPPDREQIGIIDIDPSIAKNKSLNEKNDIFKDRRPELYGL